MIDNYLEPSQVNAFVYCKRKWYYQYRLKLPITNYLMEIGSYIHSHYWMKTIKRKEIYLISHKWKLKGRCDYVIEEDGFQVPIEIKKGRCNYNKPYKNDTMQLVCYLLLLEEHFSRNYEHGYILYVGSKNKFKVNFTLTLRSSVQSYFKQIQSYLKSKKMPKAEYNEFLCRNCSFGEYCWCK